MCVENIFIVSCMFETSYSFSCQQPLCGEYPQRFSNMYVTCSVTDIVVLCGNKKMNYSFNWRQPLWRISSSFLARLTCSVTGYVVVLCGNKKITVVPRHLTHCWHQPLCVIIAGIFSSFTAGLSYSVTDIPDMLVSCGNKMITHSLWSLGTVHTAGLCVGPRMSCSFNCCVLIHPRTYCAAHSATNLSACMSCGKKILTREHPRLKHPRLSFCLDLGHELQL